MHMSVYECASLCMIVYVLSVFLCVFFVVLLAVLSAHVPYVDL